MANKEIIVKENVDIVTYSAAVKEIVNKYFDDDSNYTPQFGRANAVGVFFNYFVDVESFDAHFENVENELDLDFILGNSECMSIYNKALKGDGTYCLNFANAYTDAVEIVRQRNASFSNVIENIKSAALYISDKIAPTFSGDNLERLSKIAEEVSSKDFSTESVVAALSASK